MSHRACALKITRAAHNQFFCLLEFGDGLNDLVDAVVITGARHGGFLEMRHGIVNFLKKQEVPPLVQFDELDMLISREKFLQKLREQPADSTANFPSTAKPCDPQWLPQVAGCKRENYHNEFSKPLDPHVHHSNAV